MVIGVFALSNVGYRERNIQAGATSAIRGMHSVRHG